MTMLGSLGRDLLDVWNRWGMPRGLEEPMESAEPRARHYILAGVVSDAFAYGPSILEVGCGAGTTYAMLRRLKPVYRGFDRSEAAIARCRERFRADTTSLFEVGGLDRIEHGETRRPDGTGDSASPFDVVILNGALDALPLSEIRPALDLATSLLLGSRSLLIVVSARTPRASLVWAGSMFMPEPAHIISVTSRGARGRGGWTIRAYTHLRGDRGQGSVETASAPS